MADTYQGQMNVYPDHKRSLTQFKATTCNKAAPNELPNQ